jgi:hypothetical protein
MRRLPLAALFKATAIVLLGLFGTVAGSIAAVFLTPAGRGLAGRTVSEQLDQLIQGDIEVGSVGGPLWSGLEIERIVIRDTAGDIVLEARRLAAGYRPVDLIAGRIVLHDVTLDGLRITLEQHRDGHWNYSTLLRPQEGVDTVAGAPPLVRLERVEIIDGRLQILRPWDPPDSMRTARLAAAALAEARRAPGRVIEAGPEGFRSIVTFDRFGGRFPLLRVATPERAPFRAEVDSLAIRVSEPAVDLRDAVGTLEIAGDTLKLDLHDVTLPSSLVRGKGTIRLGGKSGPRFDLAVDASQVALRDLRGIVPGAPDLAGSGSATLLTRSNGRLGIDISALDARGRQGRAKGRLTAVTGGGERLAFERLDLEIAGIDPQAFRDWLGPIPLQGTLDGHVVADGPLGALMVDADIIYRDSRVAGRPANHVSAFGRLRVGGVDGVVFDTLTVRESDLDLATVTVLIPSNPVVGRASIDGELTGPWLAFTWRGTAQHRDGERPVSVIRGTVRLDARPASPRFDIDVGVAPLALDGLAGTWQGIPLEGILRGTVKMRGTAERFALDADLDGTVGHLVGGGLLGFSEAGWVVDSLELRFDSLDAAALGKLPPHTQLIGTLKARGAMDPAGVIIGRLDLALGAGWIREMPLDSAAIRVRSDANEVVVDTGFMRWPEGRIHIGGRLARHAPAASDLRIDADVADLGVFDSLVTNLVQLPADTSPDARPLSGKGTLALVVTGALDSLALAGRVSAQELSWRRLRLSSGSAEVNWGGGAAGLMDADIRVDSASWQTWSVSGLSARTEGRVDSLAWEVAGRFGPTDSIDAAGDWRRLGDTVGVGMDRLTAKLTAHTWELDRPTRFSGVAGSWRIDPLVLIATDGSGELRVDGAVPGEGPGLVTLTAQGVDLRDLAGMLERDTIGIIGRLGADLTIGGTAAAPLIGGTFSLSEGGFRDFRAPYLQGALDYSDRQLQATAILWRTGKEVLSIRADTLPVDLALTGAPRRLLPGPITVRATADSADLGLLEAFTKNLRRVRGALDADVLIKGSWDSTRLSGTVRVRDAAATLPGLGVRWDRISADVRLAGDSVVIDTIGVHGGEGTMVAKGWVRFPRRASPILDVAVRTNRFRAMDVRNYLTLVTTSTVQIRGPLFGATLTGRARADAGALYFADLVTKQIVDLNDPVTADLIDTALVREARLGPSFQNRFVDSLRIDTLRLAVGEDFWLRSADANVKLSGEARINKIARTYRLDGTLTAERGQYALRMGPITRDFEVQRGTVRFLGTPDLNAELDLTAQHEVVATDGSQNMTILARISGTLLVPKLTMSNPDNPQMEETEMVSYLMFGSSTANMAGSNTAEGAQKQVAYNAGMSYVYAALSSEIERTLISDLGVPVDYIQIRPGGFGGNELEGSTSGLTTVTAGWQVGRQTFVALNAGVCANVTELSYRNFGASLEQRLHKDWRAMLSVEPVITCSTAPGGTTLATSSIYQLGLDLLWDREY